MGDAVEENEVELIDIDLDWHAPSPLASSADASTGSGRRRPRLTFDPRWLILLAVVVYVGWFITSGGDDEPAIEPVPAPVPTTTGAPAETVTIDDDRVALVGDPSLDLAAAIEELTVADYETSYLEMQVNPNGVDVFAVVKEFVNVPGGFRFGYIGADGRPVVIDTSTGDVHSIVAELPLGDDTGFAVLPDGAGTVGLDPVRPTGAWRVASDVSVVRRHTGELFGVIETAAGVEYGPVAERSQWATLPAGAEVWIEPAVGVFLTPDSGGVFELTPDGAEMVTPFEMVATNGTRWIELRRVEGPNEYWVVDRSGAEWLIDRSQVEVEGDLSISPDGAWVFAADGLVDSDFPAFWGVETGEIIEVESRADRLTPVWAPDSSFVAELDPTRDCIWINFISGLNGCIVLDNLNVPALDASALVVY
ncbi:MAG: hypothetical protein AAGA90_03550 [Actinomycetota bacterium]